MARTTQTLELFYATVLLWARVLARPWSTATLTSTAPFKASTLSVCHPHTRQRMWKPSGKPSPSQHSHQSDALPACPHSLPSVSPCFTLPSQDFSCPIFLHLQPPHLLCLSFTYDMNTFKSNPLFTICHFFFPCQSSFFIMSFIHFSPQPSFIIQTT